MKPEKPQALFWFVTAVVAGDRQIGLAVAAFTENSARRQARKRLGSGAAIKEVAKVLYAHAWAIDFRSGEALQQER